MDNLDFTRTLDVIGLAIALLGGVIAVAGGRRSRGPVAIGLTMMLIGGGFIVLSMNG